ncbi:MAG: FecR domain-containing protein [Bacteriovorax sp.]|nr:FecR domain-containing protein [Bacteriovorax sp.]
MKNILSLSALIFLILTSSAVFALVDDKKDYTLDLKTSTLVPKFIGKVKIIRGKVLVGENELAKGDKIYPKNVIVTSDKSFVVIDLVDETVLSLGPLSEFTMENWGFRNKSDREGTLSLIKGKMRVEIKMKTKEEDQLKIKSPLVAMGIRGTEVLLNNSQVKGKWLTQVALIEGKVVLINKASEKNIPMTKDDYIEVTEGADVAELVRKLNEGEIKKYNTVIAPGEKHLMDYPPMAINEVVDTKEAGTDGGALVKHQAVEQTTFSNPKESGNWKDNLNKLNELRKKR